MTSCFWLHQYYNFFIVVQHPSALVDLALLVVFEFQPMFHNCTQQITDVDDPVVDAAFLRRGEPIWEGVPTYYWPIFNNNNNNN